MHHISVLVTLKTTNLLDLSHDLIGISGAGGLHGPGEPQGPRLHLGGLGVHHVGVGDVALASRGEGAVHAHGVGLAASTANTETAVHPTATRGLVSVSCHSVNPGHGSSGFYTKGYLKIIKFPGNFHARTRKVFVITLNHV